MLLTEEVEIILNSKNAKLNNHLQNKGYFIPKEVNKYGNYVAINDEIIKVKTMDLPDNDLHDIEYLCDYCLENGIETIVKNTYQRYKSNLDRCILKKDACPLCKSKKTKEANMFKYGVENVSQLDEVKKKKEDTFIEHYGVPCNLVLEEVKEKIKTTNIKKYGVDNVAKNTDIKEKARQTNLRRYGTDWTSQSKQMKENRNKTFILKYGTTYPLGLPHIKAKVVKTSMDKFGASSYLGSVEGKNNIKNIITEKYGVENVSQLNEVKIKKAETYYKNGTVATSNQQRYLWKLIGGELNYSNETPNLDIAFPDDMIYIEFNGSGHTLPIKTGWMLEYEFNNKERRRYHYLKNRGWKSIIITSPYDYLPSDEIILDEIRKAREWFDEGGKYHSHYNIDIGDKINDIKYGKLRRIKEKDLNKFEKEVV